MKIKLTSLLLFILISPVISMASAYWMEVNGPGKVNQPVRIRIYYGNIDEQGIRRPQGDPELSLTGQFKLTVKDEKGDLQKVPISLHGDRWEGTFTPSAKGVYQILGTNDTHPVVDRSKTGGKNVLPVDYLCASYQVESTSLIEKPAQFLDILTFKKGDLIQLKAFRNGVPVSTKIRIFNPENWEKELTTDQNGEAVFKLTIKGLYIIRQDWENPAPGTYQNTPYTSVRYRCNYFLKIE